MKGCGLFNQEVKVALKVKEFPGQSHDLKSWARYSYYCKKKGLWNKDRLCRENCSHQLWANSKINIYFSEIQQAAVLSVLIWEADNTVSALQWIELWQTVYIQKHWCYFFCVINGNLKFCCNMFVCGFFKLSSFIAVIFGIKKTTRSSICSVLHPCFLISSGFVCTV